VRHIAAQVISARGSPSTTDTPLGPGDGSGSLRCRAVSPQPSTVRYSRTARELRSDRRGRHGYSASGHDAGDPHDAVTRERPPGALSRTRSARADLRDARRLAERSLAATWGESLPPSARLPAALPETSRNERERRWDLVVVTADHELAERVRAATRRSSGRAGWSNSSSTEPAGGARAVGADGVERHPPRRRPDRQRDRHPEEASRESGRHPGHRMVGWRSTKASRIEPRQYSKPAYWPRSRAGQCPE
jgi:hypothetical protein